MDFMTEAKIIETVLFMESEPVDIINLSRITKLSREIIIEALKCLHDEYDRPEHGIELTEIGGGYGFAPKKELWEILKSRYGKKNENRLSRAALETLSIIAYSQPITKGEIESIRGVSADGMIKLLISRDLIREVGKKDIPGKPIQFGTTKSFLKLFRLKSIAELPKLDDIDRKKFELNENNEQGNVLENVHIIEKNDSTEEENQEVYNIIPQSDEQSQENTIKQDLLSDSKEVNDYDNSLEQGIQTEQAEESIPIDQGKQDNQEQIIQEQS